MSFRKKLLLLFAATVLLCVAVISVSVYSTIRRSFEQADQDRANAVASQFRSEFQRRGLEVARKVAAVVASDTVQHIALDMNRGATDSSDYVTEARALAGQQQLDFLELVDARGTIFSSAQWQAKFGYPEAAIPQDRTLHCDSRGSLPEARRAARRRHPRPVCRAGGPRRRTTCLCHRRRAARPGLPLHARHSHRDARVALSESLAPNGIQNRCWT